VEQVNGQHDKESKKPLNGKKPEVVSVDSKPPTRPFVLYAIVFLVLLGAAAAVAYFTMSESSNQSPFSLCALLMQQKAWCVHASALFVQRCLTM